MKVRPKASERLRGRAGVEQRLRRLKNEPLCRHCLREKPPRVTASTVPDHIIPLGEGGKDTDANVQCLCGPCHSKKTKEDAERLRSLRRW